MNIQKKFTGLITSNKEKNIFSSSLVIERAERTKENLSQQQIDKYEQENNYQFSVTQTEYLIQLLKLGQYAISNNEGKAWQDFCFNVSSTSKTQQIKTMADAAIALATRERNTNQLADLVDKVVSYDIQSKWLNIVFMEKVLEYKLKPPTAILGALEEDFNQLKLEPIKQASNLIKEMIAQIPLWEEANKFPRLYEEFKEKIQQINPDLQWNPEASSLEKILKLENLDTLTDTLDKINKSLEHSSNYQDPQGKDLEDDKGNNLQAARFLLLVTEFYGVMKIWIKHNEFEKVEPYLEQMEQFLIQKKNQILTKEEFNPSPNFAVNTSTINVPGNESRRVTYKTLEDFLTLTHQNGKTIIAKLSEPHCRIIINQCPDLVKNLNQQLDDAIVFNKKHIIPTTMIKLEDNQLTITKNIPLRHHACIASIQFNFTIRETSISFSMFGSNAYGRLDHIKLDEDIALTAAGIRFIKGPSINTKEREVAYSAKIKDNQQVNLIIQNINKSIDTSFEIIRGDLQLPLAKVKLMKQRLYILKQYDQLAVEEFKELANVAKIMLIEPTKFFNTSSTSSNLNKSHIEVLSKILDFCDARELFEVIVLHEHKLPKELVKHFFEKSGTNVNKLLIAFLQHTTETEQVLLLIYLILNNDPNLENILKNQLTNFKKSMQTSTKWWQELNPEVQSSLLPKLFSPQISLNPELNLIVLAILQDPLKLLIQLNAEDHLNFVSSLFNLLESKDSELQATIINILKMPLQLLRYLNSEAHSNFILRIFDLRNNEDPKIQALLQNTLKQSFELLIHLKSPVHSSFILSFFNLLNTSEPELKSIVLNILKNPSELLTYLKPPAHDNFVTSFFDLKDSKDLEIKLIIQDILSNPIKLLTYLKSNAHHRFISCLFDLKNSQEPEQKLIALNILKDPLGLLPHIAPEAHPSFISNFFNLQNSKTPELQSTILQLLRNPLELLSRLSTEAYPSFVTSLFDLYNSKDLEIKSTILQILKDPLGLLVQLKSHAHHSFITKLFDLQNSKDPALKSIVLNILKDPLDLLGHLKPPAHPSFITKLFDLLNSKDSELKAIACTLKEPITLLARLSPGAYHSFMPKLFSLLNSQDQSLKLIALTALQTPIELFKVLDIKDRKIFQQKYSSFDKVLTKDQEKLKAFASDEALAIDQAGYATIDDLKNLSVDKIASFTSKEAKTVYESGGTLTFMLNYSLDTAEGKKLLELYSQGKKEEADKYQIIECTKNMVAAYLLVASPKLVLFSQTMDKFIEQLAISKIGTKESTDKNKQQVREEITVVLENSLKILIENPVQQGLLKVALQFMEVHDLSKHVSKKNILPDSTE